MKEGKERERKGEGKRMKEGKQERASKRETDREMTAQ